MENDISKIREERKRVCVNFADWLCKDGKCEHCRSYLTEWELTDENGQRRMF